MTRLFALILMACALAAPAIADAKLEKGVAAPAEIPAVLKALVDAQGVRVSNEAGRPYIEMWLNKSLDAQAGEPAGDLIYGGMKEGAFLGVWRFVADGSDYRGRAIQPGFYSMRYALMPADGNHMGVNPYRDFVLLIPADLDAHPETNLKFDEVVALSKKSMKVNHPGIFPMAPADAAGEPSLSKDDLGHWVFKGKAGALPVAVVVIGRGEG